MQKIIIKNGNFYTSKQIKDKALICDKSLVL